MPFGNPSCMEDGSFCNFSDAPFNAMQQPFILIFGAWWYPIIYGLLIGVIWLKTKDFMLTGMVGLMVAGAGITSGALAGWNTQVMQIGVLLLAVALGIIFYQLFIVKSANPSQ